MKASKRLVKNTSHCTSIVKYPLQGLHSTPWKASNSSKTLHSRVLSPKHINRRSNHLPASSPSDTATPPSPSPSSPLPSWKTLLSSTYKLVITNFWPLVLLHGLTDAVAFLLHRLSHRLTNQAAVSLLSTTTQESIGNMWWLSPDPAIANFETGYQYLSLVFFLLAFPLNVAVKSWASIATILICSNNNTNTNVDDNNITTSSSSGLDDIKTWNPVKGLRASVPMLTSLGPQVKDMWTRVFSVELLVAAIVIPCQVVSLAVITLPLTLPLILDVQASSSIAVLEGKEEGGKEEGGKGEGRWWKGAVEVVNESRKMLKPLRWRLAVPFVGLIVMQKVLDAVKGAMLTSMPQRYYRELVEIPLVIVVGGTLVSVLMTRLLDVLPFVAYKEARKLEVSS